MANAMLAEKEWNRNVGTGAYPVSFLHEYAVGLIWDKLHLNLGPVTLPTLDGSISENVMERVDRVIVPDALQSIAGVIPDLSLLRDSRPVRCIEVVVSNPVPQHKLTAINNLGVEVVQVPVRNEEELRALFSPRPEDRSWWRPKFSRDEEVFQSVRRKLGVNWQASSQCRLLEGQENADKAILGLIGNLSRCSPEVRRAFVGRLQDITSLESLYPIRQDNPKYACLQCGQE